MRVKLNLNYWPLNEICAVDTLIGMMHHEILEQPPCLVLRAHNYMHEDDDDKYPSDYPVWNIHTYNYIGKHA